MGRPVAKGFDESGNAFNIKHLKKPPKNFKQELILGKSIGLTFTNYKYPDWLIGIRVFIFVSFIIYSAYVCLNQKNAKQL